jgi:GTP-binding protein
VRAVSTLPAPGPPEIAIAGRSNVGKSTLLNALAQRRSLARTSKTPGRTRGLIFYDLVARAEDTRPLRLVDLPGYGYARVPTPERLAWRELVEGYVQGRPTLRLLLALVDARRGIEDEERELLEWLATMSLPHTIVATKADKLTAGERGLLRDRLRAALGPGAPGVIITSAQTGDGVDRVWATLWRSAAPPG